MLPVRTRMNMDNIAAADILVIASSFLEQKACPSRWCCEVKAFARRERSHQHRAYNYYLR
jgi:hypothetical protein